MIKVAIVGGSGYAGQNIINIIKDHPQVTIDYLSSTTMDGQVNDELNIIYEKFNYHKINKCDVVFLAVPHGVSKKLVPHISTRIIDLSSDFRTSAIYGLPEINKKSISNGKFIANPGCYATASILSIYPIRKHIDHVVFNCISGYSGAGKNAKDKLDIESNIIGYNLTNHFHIKEIKHIAHCNIYFTPHVVDIFSGLMCTAHIFLKSRISKEEIFNEYRKFYKNSFTKVYKNIPSTKDVVNTPYCHIGGFSKSNHNQIVVVSVLDNLLKGAASQAIENMNLMFGPGQLSEV